LPNDTISSYIFNYINQTNEYEGVYFIATGANNSDIKKTPNSNEIRIYLDNISKNVHLNLIDNTKLINSIERVRLIQTLSEYLSINKKNLKLTSIHYDDELNEYPKQTLIISITITNTTSKSCSDFIQTIKKIFENNLNTSIEFQNYPLFHHRIIKIEVIDNCDMLSNKIEIFNYSVYNNGTLLENLDGTFGSHDDFLIAIIIPSTIIGSMLVLSVILACILNFSNKRNQRNAELRHQNPIYRQKSYLSKGVPVILYDEMTDKSIEEEDTLSGGHRAPLIMRNEKPPQIAPPEYQHHKQLSLQHLNDEQTMNNIPNMLNNAPLASTEAVNDDTIPFLISSQNDHNNLDLAFYQPPMPIAAIKDVSRRSHTNTNLNQTTQFLP
jgi:hypothetical protein